MITADGEAFSEMVEIVQRKSSREPKDQDTRSAIIWFPRNVRLQSASTPIGQEQLLSGDV